MLHRIWLSFFLIAFFVSIVQAAGGDLAVFSRLVQACFDMAALAVELSIGLIGLLAFWMGVMRVGEASGVTEWLARRLSPLFTRLMPEVPKGHPAISSMTLNLSANVFGLDNAATPLGLRAMQDLQTLNPRPDTATNAQILFLVLNTSSVTLFPMTILLYRAQLGAAEPADVFLPILLATSASTLTGLLVTAWVQRVRLADAVLIGWFAAALAFIASVVVYGSLLGAEALQAQSTFAANLLIFSLIVTFLWLAHRRQVNVYEQFVEGAKGGFQVAIDIIPYLLAMLVAVGVFRASGALDLLMEGVRVVVGALVGDTRFVDALPTALMKPLSGSGARAMMVETMNHFGVDSFQGRLAAIVQGSTETTFYVLAVYFGAVRIRHTRHALACGLAADAAGIAAAIAVAYAFFG